jgi:chaperone BCS1
MNEYLAPGTARWYADRGIPLRRGYLFYGPPGTGKTSFSFALAGVFGLAIYVISLLDSTMTEEDLLNLFISLPRRCVVLLEDIDTAGLRRPNDTPTGATSSSSSNDDERKSKNDWKVSDLARQLKRHGSSDSSGGGISLAGLLNAIDGVASQEGRLLIMTTNKRDTLDDALIRPGRVDRQVEFTNATSDQARELFLRMYEPENNNDVTPAELSKFASDFCSHIVDGEFSPAQLQGYLLMYKNTPLEALKGVEAWVKAVAMSKVVVCTG